jgi:hypothetical protein
MRPSGSYEEEFQVLASIDIVSSEYRFQASASRIPGGVDSATVGVHLLVCKSATGDCDCKMLQDQSSTLNKFFRIYT